ncbi:hypothetical protein KY362_02665 [Candidatus Woesearchaeota archaeon]|nr:hypothetical protein [Candidatus Woesearchaeota archaeon]
MGFFSSIFGRRDEQETEWRAEKDLDGRLRQLYAEQQKSARLVQILKIGARNMNNIGVVYEQASNIMFAHMEKLSQEQAIHKKRRILAKYIEGLKNMNSNFGGEIGNHCMRLLPEAQALDQSLVRQRQLVRLIGKDENDLPKP